MLIIPVNSEPDRRMQVLLGGNLLTLRTYWNPTAGCWFMDISDSSGVSLARGLALVPEVNVLENETELTRTLGQFRVIPLDNTGAPTYNTLGTKARLWWFAPGEWEAAITPESVDVALAFDVRTMYSVDPFNRPKSLRYDGTALYDGTYYYAGTLTPPFTIFLDGSRVLDGSFTLSGN